MAKKRKYYILICNYKILLVGKVKLLSYIDKFFKIFFLVGLPQLATYIFFRMNEPELGARINLGMAFNPFLFSILDKTKRDLNLQTIDCESSPLITRPDWLPLYC